ncbi:MAG TPA: diguanylate cyclase [Armatimonadota bacterium]|nr:diguanylate cyclase [Armatimonadota bacterium]
MTQDLENGGEPVSGEMPAILAGWLPALDSIADGAVVLHPDGRVRYLSSRAEQLLGFAQHEILGQTIRDFPVTMTTRDGRSLPDEAFPSRQITLTGHAIRDFELSLTRRNGSRVTLAMSAAPILSPDGAVAFILVTLTDRTLAYQAAQNLQATERYITNIFTHIQDGISILDANLTVLVANPAMERWNAARAPLVGKRCYQAYHGQTLPCEHCPSLRTLRTGESAQAIVPLRDGGGQVNGWVELFTFPLRDDASDQVIGVIEYVRDITDRVRAEGALRDARAEERQLIARLRALHDVRNALVETATPDDLFRHAVELGHHRLGFARIAIWLLDPNAPGSVIGTYGLDERGALRDERHLRVPLSPDSMMGRRHAEQQCARISDDDAEPADHPARAVGRGTHLLAPIRDAEEIIGFLSVDDARAAGPVRDGARELAELYASVLGYRYTRMRAITELRQSERRYRILAEHVSDLIWSIDMEGRITYVSPSIARMTGFTPEEVVGHTLTDVLAPASRDRAMRALAEEVEKEHAAEDPNRSRVLELELRCKDGAMIWTEVTANFLRDDTGHPTGLLGVMRDITARKQAESRLSYLAYYDALTGLPNRLLLQDRLNRALARVQREQILVAVMLMDLDRFKEVNDTCGHSAGDRLLVLMARRLLDAVRDNDTVARLGGDEFSVILEEIHSRQIVHDVTQRILAAVASPAQIDGFDVSVTASIGIALWPGDADDPSDLLIKADRAMYVAKRSGKNTCTFSA